MVPGIWALQAEASTPSRPHVILCLERDHQWYCDCGRWCVTLPRFCRQRAVVPDPTSFI